jgi:hypothetical protein
MNSFLISENDLVLIQISGGGMGALTQLDTECLAIQFVSTRGPPPFFESLVQFESLAKFNLPFQKDSKRIVQIIELIS